MTRQPSSQNSPRPSTSETSLSRVPCGLEMQGGYPIQVQYLDPTQVTSFVKSTHTHIAGLVRFGAPLFHMQQGADNIPIAHIPLVPFKGESKVEVWLGEQPFICEREEALHVAFNPHYLFGSVQVWEASDRSLETLTCSTYQLILDRISALGYPHLFRMWNYFPAINRTSQGLERYQQFCMGRHQAFSARTKELQAVLPAATAVGTPDGPLHIYFLAGKRPGIHIENPRQISAYKYPEKYGPKSPSFSRATMVKSESCHDLFVAGTASIVGHVTQHQGNPSKQTQETLRNIEAVLGHAREKFQVPMRFARNKPIIKVYIRNCEHFLEIEEIVAKHFGEGPEILYFQGSICRNDLLVEIEGIF